MRHTKIVQLGPIRDMLAELDRVRAAILVGKVTGFHAALRGDDGKATVYVGGIYKEDPAEALRATLLVSMSRALAEDPPLKTRRAKG